MNGKCAKCGERCCICEIERQFEKDEQERHGGGYR